MYLPSHCSLSPFWSRKLRSAAKAVAVCCLLAMLIWPVAPGFSEDGVETEYKIKAALVYKLSRFVAWPERHEANVPIFCVAESDPFDAYMEALNGQAGNQRLIQIRHLPDTKDLESCQVVFVSKLADELIQHSIAEGVSGPVLTISDSHGFAKAGGMVEIIRRNQRLGFIVNMQVVKKSGLHIAAPLLQMSTLINEAVKEP